MSVIEALHIQGIRSFGIKAEDKQMITFSSPLTLILGANGSGKTTIIECLKYALTGELPPGSNHGQSFIHDPKIFDFSECCGKVQLKIRNVKGERMTVTRSMKLKMKRGKMSFENIDATVDYDDGSNQISKRCIDVDTEMCICMGVSKAIINNVIFCHQEDSNWPLDEAKKLKLKFDSIFGTTEYNKAIEKFIKMRKEQQDELKLKEADLKYKNHIKKEADNKDLELKNAKTKYQDLENLLVKIDNEMKPIKERLEEILKIEIDVSKYHTKKTELSISIKNYECQIDTLSKKIKEIFEGDIYDLDRELRTFTEKMNEKQIKLHHLNDEIEEIKKLEKKIQLNLTNLIRENDRLIRDISREQDCKGDRSKQIQELCEKLQIITNDTEINFDELSNTEINRYLAKIKQSFIREDDKIKKLKEKFNEIDKKLQNEINKLREQKASTESNIKSKKLQRQQYEQQYKKFQDQINIIEKSSEKIKQMNSIIDKLEESYKEYCETVDSEAIKIELEEKRSYIKKLQKEVDEADENLTKLNKISKLLQEINLQEKDKSTHENEIKRIKNKHCNNFKELNISIESNYKYNIQNENKKLQTQMKTLNNEINQLKLKQKGFEMQRISLKNDIDKYENELKKSNDQIFNECRGTDYDELLEKCKENVKKYQMEHAEFKSSEAMYNKYINNIKELPCCPLCHKDMTSNEAIDITNELNDEIYNLPEKIKNIEKKLKQEQNKYDRLMNLKSTIENVKKIQQDLPKLKENLHEIENNLKNIEDEIESKQILIADPNTKLDLINTMLGDMSVLDEHLKVLNRLNDKLKNLKSELPQDISSLPSIEELQNEKRTKSNELRQLRTDIDNLQDEYNKQNNLRNKLLEKLNTKKAERIALQSDVQSLPQLRKSQDEINEQIDTVINDVRELESQLKPIKDELDKKEREKEHQKTENHRTLEEEISKLNDLRKIDQDLQRLDKEVKDFAELNLHEKLAKVKTDIKKYEQDAKEKGNEIEKMTQSIESIKNEISNQVIKERDLKDNKELKILQEKKHHAQNDYDELNKNAIELDHKNISREKDQLNKKLEKLTEKRYEIIGQKSEINNSINKITNELNTNQYKDAFKNYRKIFYEVEVLKRLIADLGQYRIALEWALMKYHSDKMNKINSLIRELWRKIYRGNDIDHIEIQTDEMKTDSADRKRSYNYRVVQCKNGAYIDMRGRCSAGQRVLACLIIRMALAETFSSNCGILALDEPTTNLDRSNIISLCEALNEIVEERQSQSNFMLIIITHDEEFISSLGRIRGYQKVARNNEGKSIIRKVRVA